jgi:hypothetical protein
MLPQLNSCEAAGERERSSPIPQSLHHAIDQFKTP